MEEEDQFASLIELCKPTASSQEAKFPNCPLVLESENFADTNPDAFSSSLDPTPSEPFGIAMVLPPDSVGSVQQQAEDDAVFHAPPEHHLHSNLSSSEDQNLDELCAEGARIADLGDGSRKVKVSERGLGDGLKKIRVSVGKTAVIVLETEENEGVDDTEVIHLDSVDSGEQGGTVNLVDDSGDVAGNDSVEFCNDDYVNGGLRTGGISIEDIDKFKYVAGVNVEMRGRGRGRTDKVLDGAERRRQLPVTIKGKEKSPGGGGSVKTVETKSGLLDFLDVLKMVVDTNDDSEDVDILETSKRRGLKFPTPRWWPPNGFDE